MRFVFVLLYCRLKVIVIVIVVFPWVLLFVSWFFFCVWYGMDRKIKKTQERNKTQQLNMINCINDNSKK